MDVLRIQLVQAELVWEDAQANCERLAEMMREAPADISLLPEMFNSGFSMSPAKVAEPMTGETVTWMRQQAASLNRVIAGSLAIREGDACYNRFLWVTPEGVIKYYDKRHLFRMAGEHKRYTAGQRRVIWHWRGWRILPLVCYDLRFPVWCRQQNLDYDIMLVVANWPTPRADAWRKLLPARAIENQCYVAALNRAGSDARGWTYEGDSTVLDAMGRSLLTLGPHPATGVARIDRSHLNEVRQTLPFHQDADAFQLEATGCAD